MANFVLTLDPDPARRARLLRDAAPMLPLLDGLVCGRREQGDFAAAWASAPANPVSHTAGDGGAAIVWGEAVDANGQAVSAPAFGRTRRDTADGASQIFDGFYAAAAYDPVAGLVVAGDPLGLFPIYYWQDGDFIVVASSPELFRCHPAFVARFHPAALVGILLTNGLLDGETLWRGVRRLSAGHALVRRPGAAAREIRQYTLPVWERYFDLPLSGHAALIDEALSGIVTRRIGRDGRIGMLMSGGLDSRTLAGCVRRAGLDVSAMTWGESGDIEWECARRVARAAGFPTRRVPLPIERLEEAAAMKIRWEHLANGFSPIDDWLFFPALRRLPRRVVGGYLMGSVLGYNVTRRNGDAAPVGWPQFFDTVNAWGVSPAVLARLLRRGVFGDLVAEAVARLRRIYDTGEGFGYQRLWRFALHHRERFYGGVGAWQLSFGCVPVFPAADRALLDVGAGMPAAALEGRPAQAELVRSRFPDLARLPLDRNSYDSTPLLLDPRTALREAARRRLSPRRYLRRRRRAEQRYYYRAFDLDGPAWTMLRRLADPHRARVADLLDSEVLASVLPPPGAPLPAENPFSDRGTERLLVGVLLWAKTYL